MVVIMFLLIEKRFCNTEILDITYSKLPHKIVFLCNNNSQALQNLHRRQVNLQALAVCINV